MPNFIPQNQTKMLDFSTGWVDSAKFNSKDKVVGEDGKPVGADYEGRKYRLISKKERSFSLGERIGRGFIATVAIVFSLGTVLLFNQIRKPVIDLFTKDKEKVRIGVLIPKQKETPKGEEHEAEKRSVKSDEELGSLRDSSSTRSSQLSTVDSRSDNEEIILKEEKKRSHSRIEDIELSTVMEEIFLPPKSPVTNVFSSINSGALEGVSTTSGLKISSRKDFFELQAKEGYKANQPILSKSPFVSAAFVKHLMAEKKDTAIGIKYVKGDAITNMEGALHTFLTPLAKIHLTGDYAYKGGHSANLFGDNKVRPVILSAAIQPDFEFGSVMAVLTQAGSEAVEGAPLPEGFKIPTAEEKANDTLRAEYDEQLRKHMIYHLTADHRLPADAEIPQENKLNSAQAKELLEDLIHSTEGVIFIPEIRNKFVEVKGKLLSLEVLYQTYLHQLFNEFAVLENNAPQGYVYTIDPPSIFAGFIGGAALLNRLQILAFKSLNGNGLFQNVKIIGFNDYADKDALKMLKFALPDIEVMSKQEALNNLEGKALVIHNNSDAFGQNIEFEGPSSMDGVIGSYSDAALVLKRDRPDLFDHIL